MIFINIYQTCAAFDLWIGDKFFAKKMLQSKPSATFNLSLGIDDLKYELKKRGHWADKKVEVGSTWWFYPKNRGGGKTPQIIH